MEDEKEISTAIRNRYQVSHSYIGMIEAYPTKEEAIGRAKRFLTGEEGTGCEPREVQIFDCMAKQGDVESWTYVEEHRIKLTNTRKKPIVLKPVKHEPVKIKDYEVTVWAGEDNVDVEFREGGKTKTTARKALVAASLEYPTRNSTLYVWWSDGSKTEVGEYFYEKKGFKYY